MANGTLEDHSGRKPSRKNDRTVDLAIHGLVPVVMGLQLLVLATVKLLSTILVNWEDNLDRQRRRLLSIASVGSNSGRWIIITINIRQTQPKPAVTDPWSNLKKW